VIPDLEIVEHPWLPPGWIVLRSGDSHTFLGPSSDGKVVNFTVDLSLRNLLPRSFPMREPPEWPSHSLLLGYLLAKYGAL
jgi:hypothetical protein